MEETISGFKIRGDWEEIVEFGERITRALQETGADSEAVSEWEEWRPKPLERIEEEMNDKTAQQASVNEGEGEKAGKKPNEDVQTASKRLSESYEKLEDDDTEGAVDRWQDSIDYMVRAVDTASRQALRKVENTVYKRVMTQFTPYYFDNELISANIQRVRSQEEFILEVNINNDELKSDVSTLLRQYDDRIDRWHVNTEHETDTVEAAEGVAPPETTEQNISSSSNQ